ncbi:MAG TPA: DUF1579 domain-containing protein [Planctomycetia bacterium]|nr:DUF1579 domain-containing protein [Planctomycetia bacterium]
MKKFACLGLAVLVAGAVSALRAQEPPKDFPKPAPPTKEHGWLKQMVGEWDTDAEAIIGPGQSMKCKGSEKTRMLGDYWMMTETAGEMMGTKVYGVMTVGFDEKKKKFVGTWIDSSMNHMWKYEGELDAAGNKLVLEAEGPNPSAGGKMTKFRDTLEVKSKDHKTLSSQMLGDDGKWIPIMTMNIKRKG